MNEKNLVLLVGIPGAGKSTWLRNHLGEGDAHVSRDEVRFSILDENEDYFSHETEVFDKFVEKINENLKAGKRVFADATHISWASRRKLLERIKDKKDIDIDVYVFRTSLGTCLERNRERIGRSYVPEKIVRRMNAQMTDPAHDPFKYNTVKYIFESGKEVIFLHGGEEVVCLHG